jgi:undecaprenyl diphosphate synthase
MASERVQEVVPVHVGLILDGNRRWAKERGKPIVEGHRAGYAALREVALRAADRGVQYLSAFVFSTENWKRSADEVGFLMDLLIWVTQHETDKYQDKGIRLVVIGSWEGVSSRVREALESAERKTADCDRMVLGLCFNYGGQLELTEGVARLVADGVPANQITSAKIAEYLYHPEIPPLDFVVRSSGEQRLSNFMLWRAAYAELLFVEKNWPAFTPEDFDMALEEYASRQRRFGN